MASGRPSEGAGEVAVSAGQAVEWSVALLVAAPEGATDVACLADRAMQALDRAGAADLAVSSGDRDVALRFTVVAGGADQAVAEGVALWAACAATAGMAGWPLVQADAATYEVRAEQFRSSAVPPLVGVAEVAEMLGVTKQRVSALGREDRLPAPVARLASGPVWSAEGIEQFVTGWARRRGRPPAQATAG